MLTDDQKLAAFLEYEAAYVAALGTFRDACAEAEAAYDAVRDASPTEYTVARAAALAKFVSAREAARKPLEAILKGEQC